MSAVIIDAANDRVAELAARLNDDQIVVMPYGKKERRVFAMIGSAHSRQVIERMLAIKQRSASQAIAISGIPDVAPLVGRLDDTPALARRAKALGVPPWSVVDACFVIGAIGLVLAAQDWLPPEATRVTDDGRRTVLIAGEASSEDFDIFPAVYRQLISQYGKVMVGTSANLHGDETYHVLQQEEAVEKLSDHVDVFVRDTLRLGAFPLFKHLTSTTMIDLTGPRATVLRWGNIYPGRFRAVFPDLVFQRRNVKKHAPRERAAHVLLKKLFPMKGLLAT
jgi:tRNA A37 threonylcarbamoyladenosine synthetase subunit TsaC/SUA5/YrdC